MQKPQNLIDTRSEKPVSNELIHSNDSFTTRVITIQSGNSLKSHTSKTDAFIYVISGEALFVLEGENHKISQGQYFSFNANQIHSIQALTQCKILLIK